MTEYSLLNEEAHSYVGDAYLSSQPRPLYFSLGKSPEGIPLFDRQGDRPSHSSISNVPLLLSVYLPLF